MLSKTLFTLFVPVAAFCLWAGEKPKLPEGAGKATTQRLCGTCHAAEVVMSRRESREGWSGVVEDMIERGLKGSDEEFGETVDYLVANFPKGAPVPKVNVNKAEAADLVAGVGLTSAQAAAIVKYRKENGDYKSVDDLQKVPGLKTSVIEAKKSRLEF
jgi:DNA uptake protein and related DNA-binding proteins